MYKVKFKSIGFTFERKEVVFTFVKQSHDMNMYLYILH